MKTTEYVGKVAHMDRSLYEVLGGGSFEHFANAGLTHQHLAQVNDKNGNLHSFAIIVGEIETDMFASIMTKEEANELIRSWFVPEYQVIREEYFNRYLDFHLTPARLDHIATLKTNQDILAYLVAEGFKFIKMSEFEGPQFPLDEA